MEELREFSRNEPSENEICLEAKEEAIRNGVRDFDAFSEIVDEIVEGKSALGYFGENQDLEKRKDAVKSRWKDIEPELLKHKPDRIVS